MTARDVQVVVVLAPAVGRGSVDPLTGVVTVDEQGAALSAADAAALEVALGLGQRWRVPVTALSVGGDLAGVVLREAVAVGVDRAVHLTAPDQGSPETVAEALAAQVADPDGVFVVAGVHGSDVASAAVPAYLAHRLGAEQALGLVSVEPGGKGRCEVIRRLDRGARERLAVAAPAVISVEGSVATLRRAPLRAVLAAESTPVETVPAVAGTVRSPLALATPRPWRPRTHVVAGPQGTSALERIRDLTGVVGGGDHQVRTVIADPAEAAELILDQLGESGLGPRR